MDLPRSFTLGQSGVITENGCGHRLPVYVGFLVLLLNCISQNSSLAENTPEVDERLYLVCRLQTYYDTIPDPAVASTESINVTEALQDDVLLTLKYLATREDDLEDVAHHFEELSTVLENLVEFHRSRDSIIESAKQEVEAEKGGFWKSLDESSAVALEANELAKEQPYYNPDSEGLVDGITALVAIGGAVGDWWEKSEEAESIANARIDEQLGLIGSQVSESRQSLDTFVANASKLYGWRAQETPWGSEVDSSKVNEWFESEDYSALTEHFGKLVNESRRNPEPRAVLAHLMVGADNSSGNLGRASILANEAAELVPIGNFYDSTRYEYLSTAALYARYASDTELVERGEFTGVLSHGRQAVELTRLALKYAPADSDRSMNANLLYSLVNCAEFEEAARAGRLIAEGFAEDNYFCFEYSRALSGSGSCDEALEWLKRSFSNGNGNVMYAKSDTALERLRSEKKDQFVDLTTPRLVWNVTDDWVWDDVILVNNSSFPLTGVKLKASLNCTTEEGDKTESLELLCERIEPGAQQVWVDVVSGASGHWNTASNVVISFEQSQLEFMSAELGQPAQAVPE